MNDKMGKFTKNKKLTGNLPENLDKIGRAK